MKKVKYLVAMDMDGTITKNISWLDLHKYFRTTEKAKENKEMFFRGKINYEEWMRRDIALWNSPPYKEVEKVLLKYEVRKGFREFCIKLRENSIFAIISSGIDIRAKDIAKKFGIKEVYANSLIVENGRIKGGECVVDPFKKGDILKKLQRRYNPDITIAIGDTHFDNSMFEKADINIAMENSIEGANFHVRDFNEIRKTLEKM